VYLRSPDGCTLLFSSTDGFCSIVSFKLDELGVPLPEHLLPPVMQKRMALLKSGAPGLDGQQQQQQQRPVFEPMVRKKVQAPQTQIQPPQRQQQQDGAAAAASVAAASVATATVIAGSSAMEIDSLMQAPRNGQTAPEKDEIVKRLFGASIGIGSATVSTTSLAETSTAVTGVHVEDGGQMESGMDVDDDGGYLEQGCGNGVAGVAGLVGGMVMVAPDVGGDADVRVEPTGLQQQQQQQQQEQEKEKQKFEMGMKGGKSALVGSASVGGGDDVQKVAGVGVPSKKRRIAPTLISTVTSMGDLSGGGRVGK
jgi:hypothetical protein